jgi:tetratricopeptide (TPR) repeat protein
MSHVAAMQGRREDCHATLTRAQACGVRLTYLSIDIVGTVIGELESNLGNTEAAIAALEPAVNLDAELASYIPSMGSFDLIEAYVRAGRTESAREAAACVAPHARQAWARAGLARCNALLADANEFDAFFTTALELAASLRTSYEEARTRLCFGERLRRAGRRAEARTQLRAALALFEQEGAALAGRARAELRASGETLPVG